MKAKKALLITGVLFLATWAQAQESTKATNELNTWTGIKFSHKFNKDLKVYFNPEVRLKEDFSVSKYLFETGLKYDLNKYFSVGGNYRLELNPTNSGSTELLNRYALDGYASKKFDRFVPEFRLRYTNYTDFDDDVSVNYLRYKGSVEYNIRKSKFTPNIAAEAFQQLDGSGFNKLRYSIGTDYKLFKKNTIGLDYKLDYYLTEYKNKHIISLTYKLKF